MGAELDMDSARNPSPMRVDNTPCAPGLRVCSHVADLSEWLGEIYAHEAETTPFTFLFFILSGNFP